MRRSALLSLIFFTVASASGFAQTTAPDSENGRYSFSQVPEGVLRLDTRTGQVSVCSNKTAGWACQTVPDERTALEAEIVRLQDDNAKLKREMIARGLPLPGGINPDRSSAGTHFELKLPSDAEVERVMSFFEKIWRRLVDMVHTMQRETEKKG
jgi:hypothetical protein